MGGRWPGGWAAVLAIVAGLSASGVRVAASDDGGAGDEPDRPATLAGALERIFDQPRFRERDGPVAREQLKHLWRMVRLERVAAVAAMSGDRELLERSRELADKERQRHAQRIVRLRRQGH